MGKLMRACLKGVQDLTGAVDNASLKNAPIEAWEDKVVMPVKVAGKVVQEALTFIRPLQGAMHTEAGVAAYEKLNKGFKDFREIMGGKFVPQEAYKLIDPEGKMLGAGEKVEDFFRADSAARVDAFFEGKLNADGLQGAEKDFIKVKALYVNALEKAKQFSPDPSLYPRKPFTMDGDVKGPLIRLAQKTQDANVLPYDMATLYSKKMYVRMMKAPDSGSVPIHEWFNFTYPQVTKQYIFNPILESVHKLLPEMSPAERLRISKVSNRLAGKKTWAQEIVDDIVDWAREVNGKPSLEFSPSSKFTMGITRNFYRGIQWANPGMALVNLTQGVNTAAKAGVLNSLEGAVNFATGPGRDLVRRYETALFGEFHKIFTQSEGALAKLDPTLVGFGLFNKAEYLNRGMAFHAGLSEYVAKNKLGSFTKFLELEKTDRETFIKGIRHAMDVVNETQFLYSVVHQSPLLTGPFSRLFAGQYMSYPINQMEFLWRGVQNDPVWFPIRWLAMTGVAASAAYFGAGAVFKGMGGTSGISPAVDLWNAGHEKEAMYLAASRAVDFLPTDTFQWSRGLTPANGALLDLVRTIGAFAKGDQNEIVKQTATMARSWGNMLPGFVAAKRASEGILTQLANDGKRYEAGSEASGPVGAALEATGFVPLFNKALNEYLGGSIPGVPTNMTGRLANTETVGETVKTSIGIRSREAEFRSNKAKMDTAEAFDFRGDKAVFADQAVQALEAKDTAKFQQLIQEAIAKGLISSPADMKMVLNHAMRARNMTNEERREARMPKALKMRRLLESMERQ